MADSSVYRLSAAGRTLAAVGAAAAATPLVVASAISPSPTGVGTHTALGLPACGWQATMGLPCPTCGMTTAFSHTVRGDLLAALTAQPAGLVVCVLTAMAVLGGAYAACTGAPILRLWTSSIGIRLVWTMIAVLLLGWGFKMAQAGGLV